MTLPLPNIDKYFESKTEYKNERAELIGNAVKHINEIRASQNWQTIDKWGNVKKIERETERNLAIRINMNPFLAGKKNNDTLRWVLAKCREKGRYTGLYWLLDNKKKK